MTTAVPDRDWTAIRWPDANKDESSGWIAVLPLAATEQHGPHLPLETDTLIAKAYLARVRERLPKDIPATFLPIEEIGISTEHKDFPGTRTLSTNDALKSWMAIGDDIAAKGIRKLVIVTSHGGNSAAMALIAQDMRAKHGMLAVTTSWSRFGVPEGLFPEDEIRYGVHGGAVETSIMLAAFPEQVRKDRIAKFASSAQTMASEFRWLSANRPAPFAWAAQDLNPQGAVGDATLASVDKGKALIEFGARAFCQTLDDVNRFDLNRLGNRPEILT